MSARIQASCTSAVGCNVWFGATCAMRAAASLRNTCEPRQLCHEGCLSGDRTRHCGRSCCGSQSRSFPTFLSCTPSGRAVETTGVIRPLRIAETAAAALTSAPPCGLVSVLKHLPTGHRSPELDDRCPAGESRRTARVASQGKGEYAPRVVGVTDIN